MAPRRKGMETDKKGDEKMTDMQWKMEQIFRMGAGLMRNGKDRLKDEYRMEVQ
jgi:hypothetical protein